MLKTANFGLWAAACIAAAAPAAARDVDPRVFKRGDVGPETPYGETPAEAAAKRVVFDWAYTMLIERDVKRAYEQYVSRDFCNHSHMSTRAQRPCVGWAESVAETLKRYGTPLKPGAMVEFPTLASVNGEMVTMYGKGVDIFRVQNGKITDHWDASPPAEVTIEAHAPGFKEWVWGERKGPPPMLPPKK